MDNFYQTIYVPKLDNYKRSEYCVCLQTETEGSLKPSKWSPTVDVAILESRYVFTKEELDKRDNKWISVEEQLPICGDNSGSIVTTSDEVLIFDEVFGIEKAWMKKYIQDANDNLFPERIKGFCLFENVGHLFSHVTHWQPLIESPTKKIKGI